MQASGDEFPGKSRDNRAGSGDPYNRAKMPDTRAPAARERKPPAPRRPRWPIPLALLGLLGLILAAILAWGVAPGKKQLPSNTNAVSQFGGTANVLLNQSALQSDPTNAWQQNVPVTGQDTTKVLDTSGSNARVQDSQTLSANGQQIASSSNTFAVNRTSMQPATGAPSNWNAQSAQGLTVGFPVGAQQRDYTIWDPATQTQVPAKFVRTEQRNGDNTNVYQADAATAPIKDPSITQSLPASLPRSALQSSNLPIAADQRSTLNQALPGLPDQVPVTYNQQSSTTYWVEPTTGNIIDTSAQVTRTAAITGAGGASLASVPVYDVTTRNTDQSVAQAVQAANNRKGSFNSVGRVWPWILGPLGLLALLAGLLGMRRRPRPEPVPVTPRPTVEPTTTYRPTETRTVTRVEDDKGKVQDRGQPQAPYAGQTPHTGPYRDTVAGKAKDADEIRHDEELRYPGQQQGKQPPRSS